MSHFRKYFFEIPVYSCTKNGFENKLAKKKIKCEQEWGADPWHWNREKAEIGVWHFNQIIGYIRLFVDTGKDVIKSEYWKIQHKHINLTQKDKKFVFALDKHIEIWTPYRSSEIIYAQLIEQLEMLQKTKQFKGRYLFLDNLKQIGPFLDWRSFIDS